MQVLFISQNSLASFVLACSVLVASVNSCDAQASTGLKERPFSTRIVQSGHSLTDPIPKLLKKMVRAQGTFGAVIDRSTIPGSPMQARWEHKPGGSKADARSEIGNYDLLVTTERVPLEGAMKYLDSEKVTLKWFNHAWNNGNSGQGAETILYASWTELTGVDDDGTVPQGLAPFRDRLMTEMAMWEEISAYVNANRPAGSPKMQLIPGPLIVAALFDEIEAGRAPGMTSIKDVFSDDIHFNSTGDYLITLAHYAVIYGRDPRGLPYNLGQDDPPSRNQAKWMQELVWNVVNKYAAKGY